MKVPLPRVRHSRILTDWVTDTLREAILRGHFEAGERLDQSLIAAELDVSRTPIREAVRCLEAEGFVETLPHRGAFVIQVDGQDIREVYDTRVLLEAYAVRQATPRIPEEVFQQLERSILEDRVDFEAGHYLKHYERDKFFHHTIACYCDNTLVQQILDDLNNRASVVRRFALLDHTNQAHVLDSIEEHDAVLEAMRRNDADGAVQRIISHLERSAERIQRLHVHGQRDP